MDRTKDGMMKRLIHAHFDIEPDIDLIVEIIGEDVQGRDEAVKLLEVNRATTEAGIQPIHFGPDAAHGIDLPSVIVEVTPEEFDRIERGDLALPNGWRLGRRFDRRVMTEGANR